MAETSNANDGKTAGSMSINEKISWDKNSSLGVSFRLK